MGQVGLGKLAKPHRLHVFRRSPFLNGIRWLQERKTRANRQDTPVSTGHYDGVYSGRAGTGPAALEENRPPFSCRAELVCLACQVCCLRIAAFPLHPAPSLYVRSSVHSSDSSPLWVACALCLSHPRPFPPLSLSLSIALSLSLSPFHSGCR